MLQRLNWDYPTLVGRAVFMFEYTSLAVVVFCPHITSYLFQRVGRHCPVVLLLLQCVSTTEVESKGQGRPFPREVLSGFVILCAVKGTLWIQNQAFYGFGLKKSQKR